MTEGPRPAILHSFRDMLQSGVWRMVVIEDKELATMDDRAAEDSGTGSLGRWRGS